MHPLRPPHHGSRWPGQRERHRHERPRQRKRQYVFGPFRSNSRVHGSRNLSPPTKCDSTHIPNATRRFLRPRQHPRRRSEVHRDRRHQSSPLPSIGRQLRSALRSPQKRPRQQCHNFSGRNALRAQGRQTRNDARRVQAKIRAKRRKWHSPATLLRYSLGHKQSVTSIRAVAPTGRNHSRPHRSTIRKQFANCRRCPSRIDALRIRRWQTLPHRRLAPNR